jgi:hypothetical protein
VLPVLQLRAAEQLRDEIRAERERLVGREAAVAAAEASLATHRRDMERQAAEIEHATQVCLRQGVHTAVLGCLRRPALVGHS